MGTPGIRCKRALFVVFFPRLAVSLSYQGTAYLPRSPSFFVASGDVCRVMCALGLFYSPACLYLVCLDSQQPLTPLQLPFRNTRQSNSLPAHLPSGPRPAAPSLRPVCSLRLFIRPLRAISPPLLSVAVAAQLRLSTSCLPSS